MSQDYAGISTDNEGIDRYLQGQYAEWKELKICSRIIQPVEKDLLELRKPEVYQMLGYFEQAFLKLVAYKNIENEKFREMMEEDDEEDLEEGGEIFQQSTEKQVAFKEESNRYLRGKRNQVSGGLDSQVETTVNNQDGGGSLSKVNASSIFQKIGNAQVKRLL